MAPRHTVLPLAYRAFFLVIEPISALAGAYYAHFRKADYLALTAHSDAAAAPDGAASVALSQLANMYLLFALNEALVLRATGDVQVWRTVLAVLLLADFGHLWAVGGAGAGGGGVDALRIYWDVAGWNVMDWGNVPFVYLGAALRVAFLAGVGMGMPARSNKPRAAKK
ncbi:hypothetical protein GGS23DRAFT_259042 [Durotheca rogersii]|uniref:uncharacterized protein n=1 Tax=Durotheca rogersii TaxID=419775 RepID=UPI002221264B|nr:uncharacterized protein GGS23DRAFT_259042 [Durotheca rogersii]KAI5860019.1 hypothetical protein GGS23DRAFT_259042 [Durotheca rogersii]